MLPDYLVSPYYRVSSQNNPQPAELSASQPLADNALHMEQYKEQILTARSWAGQSCNPLLEERDRHIKQQIFCAAKIKTFTDVLTSLQQQGLVSQALLQQLLAEKGALVIDNGNTIWLNLITLEKNTPLFYQFKEHPRDNYPV